jgi:hypothetical protein
MSELRQRDPRLCDRAHLRFVRSQPCCLPFCGRQAEAAHLRMGNLAIGKEPAGKGEKPHDRYTVPICPYHHRTGIDCQHNNNECDWWQRTGLNPWAIAEMLWVASGGAARALEPRPVAKPHKIRARKPRELRAKIRGGRKLQSNPVIPSRPFRRQQTEVHS